jgi:hexosaminidase
MLKDLHSIPRPAVLHNQEGVFQCSGLPEIRGDGCFHQVIEAAREQLVHDLRAESPEPGSGKRIICTKVSGLEEEAYRLQIRPEGINLNGASERGIYHGLQTLRQWVLSAYRDHGLSLPCVDIEDYPRFPWRGFMLDTSRYFYTVPFIKKLIDALSMHHINVFHWHLTDDQGWRLPVDAYPLLTEIGSKRQEHRFNGRYTGGFYTEGDIREIVAYAASRQVEVVPEVDLPGHASAILAAYPGLGCTGGPYRVEDRFGIFEDVLCAGNDDIFELGSAIFDTLVRLFPSPYVHIGGDEVRFNRWEACPKCQSRVQEIGLRSPRELQSWITMRLVRMLTDRGKIAIGWDEVLEDTEQFRLPKELVVMSWRGTEGGIRASNQGHRVIMSPNTEGCYLDHRHTEDPEEPGQLGTSSVYDAYSLNPVQGISSEKAAAIMGGQGNLWSELIYAGKFAEYMIFPRICALAEALWTPLALKDFEDFSRRLQVHQKRLDMLGLVQYRGSLGGW